MTILKLTGVTVSRGAGPVIRGVDLELTSGEIVAVVGPNGAGKTSLLEAISGVISPSAGDITLDGGSILKMSRVARSRRGLIHVEQGRAVFPSLTVAENIRLTARTATATAEAMDLFPELAKRAESPAALLSGGEQQMVVLARSFAAKPRVLLIDEMSLGLAPVVFTRLLPVVTAFARSGVAVLLVEQFTHLALGVADRALVVSSGAVTWAGEASVLRDSPETLHAAYLGS
ncbi:ATP-binding cassette domain-containing protein [Microbacterium sp. VKM Ac-2870]|uniref:ABC transporter ATP-binding protein n=1 Tax=Microbacterium sp. VKM Ac-2870 TaxID=2783825 RepID=UPI00188AA6C8|nr:ATP-binding cassette domain-containing protein [Microbacterium sp. VKM Ac-2870]MBF4562822.1 ATP-binding cassette domain-containing protein [Microbacterium sp. VKM Ac-2870]